MGVVDAWRPATWPTTTVGPYGEPELVTAGAADETPMPEEWVPA